MKSILYSLIIAITTASCVESKSSENMESSENTNDTLVEDVEVNVSYEILKTILDEKRPITNEYLTDSVAVYGKVLSDHSIMHESDEYVLVKASGGETDVSSYYLLSFSKSTGKLIDYIGLGQSAEGVDPYKINWESSISFSTVDYQYERIVDEESGAYMQGALLDSTIRKYNVNANGFIISLN